MSSPNLQEETSLVHSYEIQRSLGRVEGKLDQIIMGMSNHESQDQSRFSEVHIILDKLDARQNRTERKIWLWSGAIALTAFVLSHIPYNIFLGK